MIRTVVSIEPEDKAWLDDEARREGVPMTAIVRRAIRRLREEYRRPSVELERLLARTRATWKRGDALDYQRSLRAEWP